MVFNLLYEFKIINYRMESEPETFILTRYLYSLIEVNQSLMLALLDRNHDESMFWAYEIYYSGFRKELFDYLIQTYENLYKFDNPELGDFIDKLYSEWLFNNGLDHYIGSIIMTLCTRDYRIDQFVTTYFSNTCNLLQFKKPRKKLIIHLNSDDVKKYQTILSENGKAYKTLRVACKYQIRTNCNELFMTYVPDNLRELYRNSWEYYAFLCPVWKERIESHNGYQNHEKQTIEFKEDAVDSDTNLQNFYNIWGYEPDEQSNELQEIFIGDYQTQQLSVRDFASRYGAEIVMKKIKIKNIKSPVISSQQINSIIYTQ